MHTDEEETNRPISLACPELVAKFCRGAQSHMNVHKHTSEQRE